jgi:thiamine pyrophosphate-dependent acetolactate synthase large subunit-like protein
VPTFSDSRNIVWVAGRTGLYPPSNATAGLARSDGVEAELVDPRRVDAALQRVLEESEPCMIDVSINE